ncbi:hypothetical protein M9H77_20504 [Catharanthus roseus]|uniref:Uncharacterized protein n=1 Tax=Catharanthus roseus TaxID=4058 RepID=A0ACC0AKD4_CATRO|nr:hypothetical protein M9H77_20504 [Catharanthus roseus]
MRSNSCTCRKWQPYLRLQVKDLSTRSASRCGYSSGCDHVYGSVRGLHCTWLVPHTKASSDDVDSFRLGRVDLLEERRNTVKGVEAMLICLDSLKLPKCARTPHVGSSISGVKHSRFSISYFFLRLTQDGQRYSKPLKF